MEHKVRINKESIFFNHLGRSFLPYILLYEIELKPMCLYRLRQFINKKYGFTLTISTLQSILYSLLKLNYLNKNNNNNTNNKKIYCITNEGVLAKKRMFMDIVPLIELILKNN